MQPQQPTPPNHSGNYDFILNPAAQPRKTVLGGGSSMAMRALVVVGGLFVLAIIAAVLMQFLGKSSGGFDKSAMLSVAQDQTEIIRLATRGTADSKLQPTKNFAITASLGMATEQAELLQYLAAHGYKPGDKDLLLKQSAQVDTQLDGAVSSSTFDTVYAGIMKQELQTYQQDLSTAYSSAKSASAKAALKARYATADMLVTQLTGEN
ncbi:MAG: hypothetical protein JWN82_332 [Candidatus Saccharibacteria bacterium]|nr:hypothetical protein [Candidatus Saccharibacteria bacterium]